MGFHIVKRENCPLLHKCLLYVQPEWSVYESIIGEMVEWVKENPKWNISIQTHKFMHIP